MSSSPLPRQKQVRLSRERVQQLIADYEAGASVASLAHSYGIALTTATKHLVDNGSQIRQPRVAISTSDHPELLDLKAQGLTNVQIAKHFSCTRQAVQQALVRAARLNKMDESSD